MIPENAIRWTWDVMESLQIDLGKKYPRLKIMKTRVLKDIFLTSRKGIYKFQLDFIEQDIVFFDHVMDIREFMNLNKINIGNQSEDFKGRIVIPRIIMNLNYSVPGKGESERQLKAASDIKSIFPQCGFLRLFRYAGKAECFDHERAPYPYEKTVCFSREFPPCDREYERGSFQRDREMNIRHEYEGLVGSVVEILKGDQMVFLK
jgi:hypothetical protein